MWGSTSQQTSSAHSAAYQSVDGKITPANILWAIHLIYLRTGSLTCDLKVQKQEVSRREHHRTGGSLPFLIPCLTQHIAKPFLAPTGTTLMTGTIPTALGTMLGHLKQGYLEIVAVVMRRLMAEQHSVLAWGLYQQKVLERCMQKVSASSKGKTGFSLLWMIPTMTSKQVPLTQFWPTVSTLCWRTSLEKADPGPGSPPAELLAGLLRLARGLPAPAPQN